MEKILDFLEKLGEIFHYFSQKKKRQLIMEKNKKWGFFFTCTVARLYMIYKTLKFFPNVRACGGGGGEGGGVKVVTSFVHLKSWLGL